MADGLQQEGDIIVSEGNKFNSRHIPIVILLITVILSCILVVVSFFRTWDILGLANPLCLLALPISMIVCSLFLCTIKKSIAITISYILVICANFFIWLNAANIEYYIHMNITPLHTPLPFGGVVIITLNFLNIIIAVFITTVMLHRKHG